MRSLQKKLVTGFVYDSLKEINFCQACVEEKLHKSQLPKAEEQSNRLNLSIVMFVERLKHHR